VWFPVTSYLSVFLFFAYFSLRFYLFALLTGVLFFCHGAIHIHKPSPLIAVFALECQTFFSARTMQAGEFNSLYCLATLYMYNIPGGEALVQEKYVREL
jgi:ABC-type multidrug transport system permease subunit